MKYSEVPYISLLSILWLWTPIVYAQPGTTAREETWITNGPVFSILATTDTVYLGGSFTYIGPPTGSGVALDTETGHLPRQYPRITGEVTACLAIPDGGWYVGEYADQGRILRILPDGSLDPTWEPLVVTTRANSLVLSEDGATLYAGGDFREINGVPRLRLGAVSTATGTVTQWDPNAGLSWIGDMVLSSDGSTVFVGGSFTSMGGLTRRGLAELDLESGKATKWDPGIDGFDPNYVRALALSPDGMTVYVGGHFLSVGGQPHRYIAAVDAATGVVTTWNPEANDDVFELAVTEAAVYAGGRFTDIGETIRLHIAALDPLTGAATSWNPSTSITSYVSALEVHNSLIYVGGSFDWIGGHSRGYLAAVDLATGQASSWNPDAAGGYGVENLAVSSTGSKVFVGGSFTSVCGKRRGAVAALNAVTGVANDWNPDVSYKPYFTSRVYALAISPDAGTIYIGGIFTQVGGQERNCAAAVDAHTGSVMDWNPRIYNLVTPSVQTLAAGDSTVYVGGYFTQAGEAERNYLAAVDDTSGTVTSWNPNADGRVIDIALSDGGSMLYVAGDFHNIGQQKRNRLAALDVVSAIATAWNPNPYGTVSAIVMADEMLYAGGDFTAIGGAERYNIAALNPLTGLASDWLSVENIRDVSCLAVSNNTVFAGTDGRAYAIDRATGMQVWRLRLDDHVDSLALSSDSGTLYMGGWYSTHGVLDQGESSRPYFSQFDTPPRNAVLFWTRYQ